MDQLIQCDLAASSRTPHDQLLPVNIRADWEKLALTQRLAPPNAIEKPSLQSHFICINLDTHCTLWQQRDGKTHLRQQPPGDTLVMPAGQSSHWRWNTRANVLHLMIEPEWIRRVASDSGSSSSELINSFGRTDPRLLHLALALKEEAQTGGAGGTLFVESLTTALAAHLLREYGAFTATASPIGSGLSALEVKRIVEYIRANLASDLSLAEIARVASVSPFHFARLFKQATGQSPHQFVIDCRVEAAKHLLRRNDLSIGQIASQVGFAQQSHLAQHIRRATGVSPTAFRSGASGRF